MGQTEDGEKLLSVGAPGWEEVDQGVQEAIQELALEEVQEAAQVLSLEEVLHGVQLLSLEEVLQGVQVQALEEVQEAAQVLALEEVLQGVQVQALGKVLEEPWGDSDLEGGHHTPGQGVEGAGAGGGQEVESVTGV